MNILAIDTTGGVSSCALLENDVLRGTFEINIPVTHSETALPMVEDLLEATRISLDTIDLFAVSVGPGSFTGVRIGVATIKGLGMALDKPCVGISTLEALAANLAGFAGTIVPAMDARRHQVYSTMFHWKDGELIRDCVDQAEDATEFGKLLLEREGPFWLLGDGAEILKEALPPEINAQLAPVDLRLQKASSVARRASWMAHNRPDELVEAGALEVDYLRLSQAERERKERLEKTGG